VPPVANTRYNIAVARKNIFTKFDWYMCIDREHM